MADLKVVNPRGSNRSFYRIYILPKHIAKRDGETKKALQDELKRHQKFVKDNGLEAECAAYIAAQEARQSAYDAWQAAEGKFANLKGKMNPDYRELAALQTEAEEAKGAFEKAKSDFLLKYHG